MILRFVIDYPLKEFFVAHAAVGNRQTYMHDLGIGAGKPDPVHFKKRHHYIDPDPLVAIYKSMIGYQRVPETGSFFFLCRV